MMKIINTKIWVEKYTQFLHDDPFEAKSQEIQVPRNNLVNVLSTHVVLSNKPAHITAKRFHSFTET